MSNPEVTPITVDDLTALRGVGGATFSPDGTKLAYVVSQMMEGDNGYRSSLWLWEEGGSKQLSNGLLPTTRDTSPRWAPDGKGIAFLSNRGGSSQVWLLQLAGGEAKPLTSAPRGITSFHWAPDGVSIFYLARTVPVSEPTAKTRKGNTARHITRLRYKANGPGYLDTLHSHLYQLTLADGQVKQLTFGEEDSGAPYPSPDGTKLLYTARRGPETYLERDIWLLDLASGQEKNLTQGKVQASSYMWEKGSQSFIYVGHHHGRRPGAYPKFYRYDLASGDSTLLPCSYNGYPSPLPGADVRYDGGNSSPTLTSCGEYILFIGSQGGNSYLYSYELASQVTRLIYGEGQQVVTSFDVAAGKIVLHLSHPQRVGDLWLGSPQDNTPFRQITQINEDFFAKRWCSWPEQVFFTAPDGCLLEGWLMKPYGYQEGAKHPLVMEIHGGPNATYGNTFSHEFQVLAGLGFGVFYSNPRGSMGYGEEFSTVIIGDWCGIDAQDLQFMAEEVAKTPWVDAGKLGVTGGSQGGYFTNWLVSHTDLFAAAVSQRSMSNLYTKYGTADNGWNGDKFGMGGADLWDNEELLMSRSPIRYANKVKTPILFIHSDMDFRCPLEQAEQFYVAVK
ncbi:MAG: S9 family peptidase, partial [Symbiobacteriaceae bacterium]|nr:S9 family peptidase [Symbiobacteriaceae bacterium]